MHSQRRLYMLLQFAVSNLKRMYVSMWEGGLDAGMSSLFMISFSLMARISDQLFQ